MLVNILIYIFRVKIGKLSEFLITSCYTNLSFMDPGPDGFLLDDYFSEGSFTPTTEVPESVSAHDSCYKNDGRSPPLYCCLCKSDSHTSSSSSFLYATNSEQLKITFCSLRTTYILVTSLW